MVLHAASDPRNSAVTDVEGSRRLAEAARTGGVDHFVFVSIVGIDEIPFPYYRHKLQAEATIRGVGVPHSILRAAQFRRVAAAFRAGHNTDPTRPGGRQTWRAWLAERYGGQ